MPRKEVTLSDAVKELLEVASPTLEELATEAGVSYHTLRNWREGRVPRAATLDRLLSHLEERSSEIDRLTKAVREARARTPERRPNRRRAAP